MLPILIGAGVGLAKGLADQQQEKKDRRTQAEIQRWSPWTGLQGQQVKGTNLLNTTAQGAMAGGMLGQGMGGGAAAAPAAGAAADGTTGAIGPLADSGAYTATPAGTAMQNGTFPSYYQNAYTQPWNDQSGWMGLK